MKRFSYLYVVAALALGLFTQTASAIIVMSFGIVGVGSYTVDTVDITASTSITNVPGAGFEFVGGTLGANATAGIFTGGPVTFSSYAFGITGSSFASFDVMVGNLTFRFPVLSSIAIVPSGVSSNGSISVQYNGSVFADSGAGSPFLNQSATLSQTCTQTSIGASITCSESVQTPGVVPEPSSIALFGISVAALGMLRRRRQIAR